MDLYRLALDQHRLEGLDAETVKRRSTVQKNRMLANDLFKNVPNDRLLSLDHFAGLFDGCCVLVFFELVVNERLEKLERHFLWQTALVQFQLWADNDNGAA